MEDNPGDVDLVREALQEHGVACNLFAVNDGEKALDLLKRIEGAGSPCPDLIILDLNLPKIDGRQILKQIRASTKCGDVPVVVLSSSDAPRDIEAARILGANRYVKKPSGLEEYMNIGAVLKQLLG